jgi:hypothetical protein
MASTIACAINIRLIVSITAPQGDLTQTLFDT